MGKIKSIVIVGAGVAGVNAATTLVDNGFDGNITIIDMGKDPYLRPYEEVMTGYLGAGGWSDGKLTYSTEIGGQLSKYCGDNKAMELMKQVVDNFEKFHPHPEQIMLSDPQEEPEFIKPHFGLRMFPVWHIGTDYLHEIGKGWYDYLVSKGVNFHWETKVSDINFKTCEVTFKSVKKEFANMDDDSIFYDKLIFGVGKSGIDFTSQIMKKYDVPTEQKPVQIGVRFEAPQKYFQKLIDISYDFKLYRKFENVSLRSFCTNNNAAYVAVEETYGDLSYNGHAKKDKKYENGMTNFGILMEIRGIEDPFKWSRDVVRKLQIKDKGLFYSPSRKPTMTSEGVEVSSHQIESLDVVKVAMEGYFDYVSDFIDDLDKVFGIGDDWGIYVPEVKYLAPEPLVNYEDLSLTIDDKVHFVGDALSARGISVSGAHGIYVAQNILKL
tara:strand:- start:20137 stop:21450 length:1314 start_codon:yes stop_codon:yes gene_type:complete